MTCGAPAESLSVRGDRLGIGQMRSAGFRLLRPPVEGGAAGEPLGESPGVLAQLRHRGSFPVPGAQPGTHVIEPFDDIAARGDDLAIRRDTDAELQRIWRDEAAREQRPHQGIVGLRGPIVRTGAVEYPPDRASLPVLSAPCPPDDFDSCWRYICALEIACADGEPAGSLQSLQLIGGSRRQSVAVDIPYGPHVAQKSPPVLGTETRPELGSNPPHRVHDFAPIATDTIHLTRQRMYDAHEFAQRASGAADGRNRVGEQCRTVECGLRLRQTAPSG